MEMYFINRKPQNPIAFSFGEENNSQEIFIQDNYIIENPSRTKYQFIQKLIYKYDQKPREIPQKISHNQSWLREDSSNKKIESAEKSSFPPKPHRQQKQEKNGQGPKIEKNIILSYSNSGIKAELEKSHQELLEKFKSPLHNDLKKIKKAQEKIIKSQKIDVRGDANEQEQKQKSAISTQNSNSSGSIPLIQSVLLSNQQSVNSIKRNQAMNESPIKQLSEFEIPQEQFTMEQQKKQGMEQIKIIPLIDHQKQQNKQKEDEKFQVKNYDGEKITIFWLCFISVLIILLCYPTDWQYRVNSL